MLNYYWCYDYRKKEAEEAIKVTVVPGFANYQAALVVKKLAQQHKMNIVEDVDPMVQLQQGAVAFISYAGKLPMILRCFQWN